MGILDNLEAYLETLDLDDIEGTLNIEDIDEDDLEA